MTDIVERLGRQYDEWNNPPSPELPEGAGILLEAKIEIACIRADNERLRAALREILDVVAVTASGAEICQCSDFDFARAALGQE